MSNKTRLRAAVLAVSMVAVGAVVLRAIDFTAWSLAVNAEYVPNTDASFNTTSSDGCPASAPNGLEFYMASDRPGGLGGIDIWRSRRTSTDAPWGPPENLGAPINSSANDFCPTPQRDGKGLLFVSTRPGACGGSGSDIYYSRYHVDESGVVEQGWAEPTHLDCSVNSVGDEASPFLIEYGDDRRELFFSSTRAGGASAEAPGVLTGDADIYASVVGTDGSVGAPALVPGINSAFNDFRPSLRRDSLEIFFDSNRPGGVGGLDIWSATREDVSAAWSAPFNLGPNVNSSANETRPFLTWDRNTLYFGSTRAGSTEAPPGGTFSQDIFVTTREKVTGKD
jgi:hypothetical protein